MEPPDVPSNEIITRHAILKKGSDMKWTGPSKIGWRTFSSKLTLSIAWITGMVCKVLGVKGFAAEEDLDCKEGESKGAWK